MGGRSGTGQVTPYESLNTLSGAQSLRIIDTVAGDAVTDFVSGDDTLSKGVCFDDIPAQNPDGSSNFNGVTGYFRRGEQDQPYVPGFATSERMVLVSAAVKQGVPVVRTVTDSLIGRLRVAVTVERNAQTKGNGDTIAAETVLNMEPMNSKGSQAVKQVRFSEKSSGTYYQGAKSDTLPTVPFNMRVARIIPGSSIDKVSNNTYFSSHVEVVNAKLSYPHAAIATLAIDSA